MPEISPADRFLPHPDEDWYDRDIGTTGGGLRYVFQATPEQRRSYVRYILAGHGGKRSWEVRELADWEPESLAPWADAVTAFDDAALAQLTEVESPDYRLAAYGASDPAVDALADRIDADASKTDVARARVELLTGVDTDRALARLADPRGTRCAVDDPGPSVRPVGTLGGLPEFQQSPFWPGHCDKPMVFVGQTNQSVLGGFDETLYGFACECGAAAQVGQNT